MARKTAFIICSLLIISYVSPPAAALSAQQNPAEPGPALFNILYTNDVLGNFEPCG